MAVSKDKARTMITMDANMKIQLETQAKQENRSLSNLIETILKEYLHNKKA